MFFGGSKFFLFSMIIDKAMMIVLKYGGLILTCFLSFVISSYLYFGYEFHFKSLVEHNLISRPEIVVKYFWNFLKDYYHNREKLPLFVTFKIITLLVLPFISLKLIKIGLQFLLFYLAVKVKDKLPTISKFILRKTHLVNTVHSNPQNQKTTQASPAKKETEVFLPNRTIPQNNNESTKKNVNLRK